MAAQFNRLGSPNMYPIQATRLNTTTTEDGRQSTLESIKVVAVMLELAAV